MLVGRRLRRDLEPGRWVAVTRHRRSRWEVIVEPRTRRIEPGLVIDLSRQGQAIGIKITAPSKVSVAALNRVLTKLGMSRVTRDELAPLLAA